MKEDKNSKNEEKEKADEIRQNLSCFILYVNILDDKDIALGYPLKQLKAFGNKIECIPIPEILSYEGYINQIGKQDGKLDDYFNITFKTASNERYNYWLPIYINEEHFKRNKTLILNSFSVLKYGARGKKEYDFKPEHIFEYLPNLLNKMICGMFNQKSHMSEAYIRCYFQYLLLFKKLIEEYKDEFTTYLNKIINYIKKSKYNLNKKTIPDIGNLFMLLYFSDIDLDKNTKNILLKEKIVRKMYWTFHFEENEDKCRKIFEDYLEDNINKEINKKIMDILKTKKIYYYEYLEDFKNEKEYKPCKEECLFSLNHKRIKKTEQKIPLKGIFSKCIEKGIFENIIEIISKEINNKPKNLKDLFGLGKKINIDKKIKDEVKSRIMNEFPSLYKTQCSSEAQKEIDQLLIENINLLKYCSIQIQKNKNLIKDDYFTNHEVDILMRKIDKKYHLEITKKLFDISRVNLLLITTLAQKKLNESGFLKELEKNYGVYLKVGDFIKEIKDKLKEVQCYKDLFNFMKADVIGDNEDEYEMIINCYEKAKEKNYIKTIYKEEVENTYSTERKRNCQVYRFNNNYNRNVNYRNYRGRRVNNNYRNNRNQNNNHYNNNVNSSNDNNNNGKKRKNNFNSHFVNSDDF